MTEFLADLFIERVSFAYSIEFLGRDGSIVVIGGQGLVIDEFAEPIVFDAESPSPAASTLLGFLHEEVKLSLDQGTLVLLARHGLVLRIAASAEYEAWSVVLADGSRIVCAADATVTRWAPQ
jgi:hypothetical protein